MSKEIAVVEGEQTPALTWSEEDYRTLQATIAQDLNDSQFRLFCAQAKHLGLDPIKKELHPVILEGRLVCQISINALVKWAYQTGKFRGFTEPIVTVEENGQLCDLPPRHYQQGRHELIAVTLAARHADDPPGEYSPVTAHYKEFVAMTKNDGPNKRWTKAPLTQLTKCAQALAIRRRFPGMPGDVYVDAEVDQIREAQETPHTKQKAKRRAPLTAKQAISKGISTVKALKAPDNAIADIGKQFLANWSQLTGTEYTSTDQLPDEAAEDILKYWQSDEFHSDLRKDNLLPMPRG
jgi:phage recombination protein Bet